MTTLNCPLSGRSGPFAACRFALVAFAFAGLRLRFAFAFAFAGSTVRFTELESDTTLILGRLLDANVFHALKGYLSVSNFDHI